MATIYAEIKIPEVERTVPVRLYFPTDLPAEVGNKVNGVITLLHGLSNTANDWMTMSAAPRYAADNGFILVAPSADNSFYADMEYGSPWYSMLTELLPAALQRIFHIPTARECNYIAGLSMGGYGAMSLGLAHPERYAAIGSFSGVLDLATMAHVARVVPELGAITRPVFGEDIVLKPHQDVFLLAEKVAALPGDRQPRIYCSCGAQDADGSDIRSQNLRFKAKAEALGLPYVYREWTGVHEWNFWDRSLTEFIGYATQSDYDKRKRADWQHEHI